MNITYLLVSESFDQKYSNESTPFNIKLQCFFEVVNMLTHDETVSYTSDLYEQVFYEGQQLVEWLYSSGNMRDERKLFQLMLRKWKEEIKEVQQKRIEAIHQNDYQNPGALLMFHQLTHFVLDPCLLIQNQEDCLATRRFYLQQIDDTSVFLDECQNCFPQLYINTRVHQTIKRFKPFHDYRGELILHLTALNDHGRRLFFEYKDQSESIVLQHLGAIGKIDCSPQGDPEYEKRYLCFDFPNDQGELIQIICAPHTKLFTKYSGERIYFHWGHADVKNGEKLLIGHIGDHL